MGAEYIHSKIVETRKEWEKINQKMPRKERKINVENLGQIEGIK